MSIALLSIALTLTACNSKGEINTGDTGITSGTDGGGGGTTGGTDGGTGGGTGGGTDGGDTAGGTDGGSTGTDGGGTTGCGVEVSSTWPEDGDAAVYYLDDVTFFLTDSDPSATISVDGLTGTVTFNDAGDEVTFAPDGDFVGDSSYTATLSYCAGEESIAFSTSALGGDVDPSALEDVTWSLDLATGTISEPAGLEALLDLTGFSLDQQLLMGVQSITESTIDFLAALPDATGTAQDFCSATMDFPPADFSASPYFEIGPQDLTSDVGGYSIQLNNVFLAGTISEDASWIGGVELAGDLDISPIADAVGLSAASLCAYAATFGVSCEDCGDGNNTCLGLVVTDMQADQVSGLVLEAIDMSDCHAECPTSADNPDCPL